VLGRLDKVWREGSGGIERHLLGNLDHDNVIEQITDFIYLGYRIAEYKSDLEDKLQTYNKINEVIRRHFGKQMKKRQNPEFTTLQLKQHCNL
jgi:hypothetical protein